MKSLKCPVCGNLIEEKDCIIDVCSNPFKEFGKLELEIGCPHCPAPVEKVEINLPDNLKIIKE